MNRKEKKELLRELDIDEKILQKALKEEEKAYSNGYGRIANLFFESTSERCFKAFPKTTQWLEKNIHVAGINILSITYLSIMFFTLLLLFFLGTALGIILFYSYNLSSGIFLGILLTATALCIFLLYPFYAKKKREWELNEEYPFIINHCTALANAGTDPKEIFSILIHTDYYKAFKRDCKQITLYRRIFHWTFQESLRKTAQTNPSKEIQEFLEGYAKALEEKKDLRKYLQEEAKRALKGYKQKRKLWERYKNAKEELEQNLSLKKIFFSTIAILSIGMILLYLYHPTIDASFFFYLSLLMLLIWIPLTLHLFQKIKRDRKMEAQFFLFIKDLEKTENPLKLEKNYKELQPYIDKLKSQYKLGIPGEKAFETFGRDTQNALIEATTIMAAEARKKHANFYRAMTELGSSKILRKVLRS